MVLFMPDQLRADCVGAFGNPMASTPHIDALADRGVRFDEAYGQHTVCSQSRVSMFTGWYPHVNGHRTLTHLLQPHEPNVFRRLRESDYHVASAGARGDMMGVGVTEASSDRFGFTQKPDLRALRQFSTAGVGRDDHRFYSMWGGRLEGEPFDFDEAAVSTAIDWLTDGMPEPWCLFIPLIYPHPPFAAAEPWYSQHDRDDMPSPIPPNFTGKPRFFEAIHDRYGLAAMTDADWRELIATYYGMISRVDDQLGRVMHAVDEIGAAESTVTFFFTDHGEYLGDYGLVEKWMAGLDNCLVRNPLILHDPAGRSGVADSFVELVDLTATMLDYAEAEPTWTHFGRSLRHVLDDPSAEHRAEAFSEGGFLVEEEPLLEAGATGHYDAKQALQHEDTTLTGRAISIRTDRWTYVERLYEGPELYDRVVDPNETTNLAGSAATETAGVETDLKNRLFRWLFETSDVIPWEQDPRMAPELLAMWRPEA